MVTGERAPVLNPWGLFCYSFLPQLSWRQWVREWLGGHLAATQGQPSPCLTVPILQLAARQEKMNRRDTPDMENALVCDTHSPALLLLTLHTVSAHKIQWYLKPQGRMTRSALDTDSISGPTCLLQHPHTQAKQRGCQEVTAELHRGELQTTSSAISLWEKDRAPYSPLLWENQRNAIHSCQESILISPEIRVKCY